MEWVLEPCRSSSLAGRAQSRTLRRLARFSRIATAELRISRKPSRRTRPVILADLSGFVTGGADIGREGRRAGRSGGSGSARTVAPAGRAGNALSTSLGGVGRAAGAIERAAPAVADAARAPGRAVAAGAGRAAQAVGNTAAEILGLTTGASAAPIKGGVRRLAVKVASEGRCLCSPCVETSRWMMS